MVNENPKKVTKKTVAKNKSTVKKKATTVQKKSTVKKVTSSKVKKPIVKKAAKKTVTTKVKKPTTKRPVKKLTKKAAAETNVELKIKKANKAQKEKIESVIDRLSQPQGQDYVTTVPGVLRKVPVAKKTVTTAHKELPITGILNYFKRIF